MPKNSTPKVTKPILPFKSVGENSNLLVLKESMTDSEDAKPMMFAKDLVKTDVDEDFKFRALAAALNLTLEFSEQLRVLDSAFPIFQPILEMLETKFTRNYPKIVRAKGKKLRNALSDLKNKNVDFLMVPKKRPQALKLYEPKVERMYVSIFI